MIPQKTLRNVVIAVYVLVALALFGFGKSIGLELSNTVYIIIGLAVGISFFIVKEYRTNKEWLYYGALGFLIAAFINFIGIYRMTFLMVPNIVFGVGLLLIAGAIWKNYM